MRGLPVIGLLGFAAAIAVAAGISRWSVSNPQTHSDSPRDVFLQRVDGYVALHRRLEADLPPEIVTADPERLFAPRSRSRARFGKRVPPPGRETFSRPQSPTTSAP